MEWDQVVVSFLAGGALGTIVAAVYSSSQERAERFRERMLVASDQFLVEVGRIRDRSFEVDERGDQFAAARRDLRALADEYNEGHDDHGSQRVRALLEAVERSWSPHPSVGAESELAEAVASIREFASSVVDPDASSSARRLAEAAVRYADATVPFYRSFMSATHELDALNIQFARIRVLFSRKGDLVSEAAGQVLLAVSDELRAAGARDRPWLFRDAATTTGEREKAAARHTEVVRSLHYFGTLVGDRIRRRWL